MGSLTVTDDDGYLTLHIRSGPADFTPIEIRIDLFAVRDRLADLIDTHKADADRYYAEAKGYLCSFGVPDLSRHALAKLIRGIFDRAREVSGKDIPAQSSGSPG